MASGSYTNPHSHLLNYKHWEGRSFRETKKIVHAQNHIHGNGLALGFSFFYYFLHHILLWSGGGCWWEGAMFFSCFLSCSCSLNFAAVLSILLYSYIHITPVIFGLRVLIYIYLYSLLSSFLSLLITVCVYYTFHSLKKRYLLACCFFSFLDLACWSLILGPGDTVYSFFLSFLFRFFKLIITGGHRGILSWDGYRIPFFSFVCCKEPRS